jgi:hypothetical protein
MTADGQLVELRRAQAVTQLDDEVRGALYRLAAAEPRFAAARAELEQAIIDRKISVTAAARTLVELL